MWRFSWVEYIVICKFKVIIVKLSKNEKCLRFVYVWVTYNWGISFFLSLRQYVIFISHMFSVFRIYLYNILCNNTFFVRFIRIQQVNSNSSKMKWNVYLRQNYEIMLFAICLLFKCSMKTHFQYIKKIHSITNLVILF